MNKVILMGRLTADPEVRRGNGENSVAARYTLAVGRSYKKEGEDTDFISCVAFQKGAGFAEKYLKRGMRILVTGRLQTGSYVNKEGKKIYTTDVVVHEQEFAESREDVQRRNREEELPFC